MGLSQLADLGEFVGGVGSVLGGIAVLATLIYLALQIRQSARVAQSSMHYQMFAITSAHISATLSNPQLGDLVHRGESEPDALSEREWVDFVNYALMRFGIWEAAFVNYRAGTVSEEVWQAWDGALRINSTGPGFLRFWEKARSAHAPSFQRYFDHAVYTRSENPTGTGEAAGARGGTDPVHDRSSEGE